MMPQNVDTFLIVRFVDGKRGIWKIASGILRRTNERVYTERAALVEKLTGNIRRLRKLDTANVVNTIYKHFPAAEEVTGVHDDDRLEANRLCDLGEVFIGQFDEYDGKPSYTCNMTLRRAENNEYIHPDGTLDRFVNVMTGEKYPTPGPGERAWRISYVFKGGVSGTDHHGIIIAAEPREAIEKLLANHEKNFAENGGAATNFFAAACKRENLLSASALDIATDEYFWFSGPDLVENAETKAMNGLFGALRVGDMDEVDSMIDSIMSSTGARSLSFMPDPSWKGEDNQ